MIIPSGFAQVNLVFEGLALPEGAECTYGIELPSVPLTPNQIAQVIGNIWNVENMDTLQTSFVTLGRIDVKFGPNSTGPSGFSAPALVGTDPDQSVPPNVSLLVAKHTDFGGRAGRGRFYLPGISEEQVANNGGVNGGFLAGAQTLFDAFLAAHIADDVPMVLLHGPGSPLVLPSPITGLVVQTRVATQRQRLRK